ncbi:hypothetical protein EUGRSUZ_G00077 [Eucalyptus grandis]|uniref:Disease resistance protein At4g27190-like leucine-rich repeats domain-containing protein n=2 Tax=Eucalyptus grandis TaxID=71139 RepID=A0A059BA86_EUCGR|nr:hypothetical protein EUGRSUZ_G00077 [Eucalyptus grandis]
MPRPLNAEEEELNTEVPQGEMPRALDPLSVVEVLPNNKRKCNFCGNEYVGDTKRIEAQFAGVGGCGILGCKVFNDRVRSEAPEVLQDERAVESSKRQGNDEGSSNLTQSSHQPLTAGSEVARCKTSFVAMPYLSYGAGSSTFLPSAETIFPNQSVAALTNIPCPRNAKEGELNTEVPHENFSLWCGRKSERSLLIDSCDHIAASIDGTSGDGYALLPESVQSLELSGCHEMKRVMEWEWLTTLLPNLKEIITKSCENLEEIIRGPLPSGATCHLTYLEVNCCNNMKRALLTQDMVLHLPFLQEILVKDCKGIEVIMGTVAKMTHFSFPKLMNLGLCNLPELKSICDGTTRCNSLQLISIDNCPKLKGIPLQLPVLDNGLPSPPPSLQEIRINRQTWESLEWDHPLARSTLEHFIEFLD